MIISQYKKLNKTKNGYLETMQNWSVKYTNNQVISEAIILIIAEQPATSSACY